MRIIITEKARQILLKKSVNWGIVIIYLGIIFMLSNQPAWQSDKLSKGIVKNVSEHVSVPDTVSKSKVVKKYGYDTILRKTAHFTEYFLLAMLFYRALSLSGLKKNKSLVTAFFLSMWYAALDEFHQRFVPGRGPRLEDVMIDIAGGLLAIAFLYFYKFNQKEKRAKVKLD